MNSDNFETFIFIPLFQLLPQILVPIVTETRSGGPRLVTEKFAGCPRLVRVHVTPMIVCVRLASWLAGHTALHREESHK